MLVADESKTVTSFVLLTGSKCSIHEFEDLPRVLGWAYCNK